MLNKANRVFWEAIYGLMTGAIFGAIAVGVAGAACLFLIPQFWEIAEGTAAADWGAEVASSIGEDIGESVGKAVTGGIVGSVLGAGIGSVVGLIRKMFY